MEAPRDGDDDVAVAFLAPRLLWPSNAESAALDTAFSTMVRGGRAMNTLAKWRLSSLKLTHNLILNPVYILSSDEAWPAMLST